MAQQPIKRGTPWAVYVTVFIVLALSLVFLYEFVRVSQSEMSPEPSPTAESITERVETLLTNGVATNGEQLLAIYGCIACHRSESGIAPSFVGLAERAETRRPPLTAAEYIYESITQPNAYVVEEFQPAMPPNYAERISDQELGDIIAYLLSAEAH